MSLTMTLSISDGFLRGGIRFLFGAIRESDYDNTRLFGKNSFVTFGNARPVATVARFGWPRFVERHAAFLDIACRQYTRSTHLIFNEANR
ncbi:hypothetical protein RMSM_00625 [Rhodopirellula maiorica SM1]|uniref:Uncharacterized protein n=1 Tax=Rhodopirellula maiorica SM1 TaxID=1265738 RepID=M5RTB7_9BACT|nr:hypothetical protein RMSM_00625 [Rhodopirellula maiorica SM1]